MDPMKIFVPITKIDVERREIWGVLAEERVDKSGEIFDYAKSKPHFEAWSKGFEAATDGKSKGNLRAMHGNVAAGKFIAINFNDDSKQIEVGGKVVDDNEWAKCVEGVYTGLSVGGNYVSRWHDAALKAARYEAAPIEGSLVDNPCMYGATFQVVKADGAVELRKFTGAAETVTKDAAAAIDLSNDAIAALKALTAELATLPGEPDTWAIEDCVSAIRLAVSAKMSAETAAGNGSVEGPVAGAGPMEPKAAEPEGVVKADEPAPAPQPDPPPADPPPPAAPEPETDPEPEVEKLNMEPVLDALRKVAVALDENSSEVKAISEGLGKAVGETVSKAVETAKAELGASIEALTKRVSTIEQVPRPPGRPIEKVIGGMTAGDAHPSPIDPQAILKMAREAGANETVLAQLRVNIAAALMPR